MTTVAVTCARDEIDLIEPFVRHTLWYADRLIVLDNGSTDGTCEVLKALREEGLPLDVVADPSPGKHLSRRMTRLMCEYAVGRYGADWVLPLDADEFVCVRDEGLLIPEGTALDRPLQLSWRNYVPAEDDDPAERNPVIRLRHRLTNKDRPVVKVVVPGELARRPGAVITTGSHTLEVEGRECPGVEVHHAYLAHFPVRTPGQFVAKTVIGFLQNELVLGRNPCHGFHHRENYELLKRDPAGFVRDFARAVRHYTGRLPGGADPAIVVEPFPYRGGPLRYTPEGDDAVRTWKPILEYAQGLAREHGLLRASLNAEGSLWFDNQADVLAEIMGHLARQERDIRGQDVYVRQCHEQLLAAQANLSSTTRAAEQERLRAMEFESRLMAAMQAAEQERVKATELARQKHDIQQSWSWRIGRFALGPARLARGAWAGLARSLSVAARLL